MTHTKKGVYTRPKDIDIGRTYPIRYVLEATKKDPRTFDRFVNKLGIRPTTEGRNKERWYSGTDVRRILEAAQKGSE